MKFNPRNIAIVGASGAIGHRFQLLLSKRHPDATLLAFSQHGNKNIDYNDEKSMAAAAELSAQYKPLDLVIVANSMLHNVDIMPEKSLKDLSAAKFQHLFKVNTITPALIAKYFLPKLNRGRIAIFAALSARVGSVSDNKLGGWYAYRASKAALNMIIKNASIEMARKTKTLLVLAYILLLLIVSYQGHFSVM